MKKIVVAISLLASILPLNAGHTDNGKNLPKDHLLTIENETGHRLFIMEDKSFKRLDPQEAVVLYWKQPLKEIRERTISVYYGGNIRNEHAQHPTLKDKKSRRHFSRRSTPRKEMTMPVSTTARPIMIAQLRTNQAGTIVLSYDDKGVLKMERI